MDKNILHSTETEQALLGALILDNCLMENIPDYFAAFHFASELHSKIYEIIRKARDHGTIADPITISFELQNEELFKTQAGKQYIADLADAVISLSNVSQYAEIIYDLYLRRQVIGIADETMANAIEIKPALKATDIIEQTEQKLFELSSGLGVQARLFTFSDALAESIESAEAAFKRDNYIVGVSSGFKALDKWLGGFHRSDLLIVAGRPSMGKTAFATNVAFNAAKLKLSTSQNGAGVIFFSLEMSAEQLATRILASESGVSSDNIRRGEIPKGSFDKFLQISKELEKLELFIDDTPNITVGQMRNRVRRLKRKHDIGLIVIDYLQLVEVGGTKRGGDSRVNEVSEITRALKGLAKEMNVPVIALSQLSRAVEQRDDKKPQLADLRESGSIEQDADVVMFVFREEYYKARKEPQEGTLEHDKWQLEMEKVYNRAEIIIAKQRHGPVGNVKLFFDGRFTRFGNLMENS